MEKNLTNNEIDFKVWAIHWIRTNRALMQLNKRLYERTELYEHGYERNFDEDLHNFFAKKITRFKKDENELLKLIKNETLLKEIIKEI